MYPAATENHEVIGLENIQNSENESIALAVIQSAYEFCEILNEDSRDELIKNISDRILNAEIILKNHEVKDIAAKICSRFPVEEMEYYFTDGTTDSSPGGRLYNYYHNKLKRMRKKNLLPPSKRTINKILKLKEAAEAEETYILNEGEVNSIKMLQKNLKLSEIALHWNATFDYRQNVSKFSPDLKGTIDDEWKVLKLSLGHILICEDFKVLHGIQCGSKLRRNWSSKFTAKTLLFLQGKVRDMSTIRLLRDLPTTDENLNVATIFCLNAILVPPLQKGLRKPTIKDAQDSIVLTAKGEDEIQEKIADRFEGEIPRKHHPIIFKVQHNDEPIRFLVLFHNLRYNFKRFYEAIDVCFKIFIVFQIPFPEESTQFYVFLNEQFYQLNLNLKKSAKVITLLENLKFDGDV